MLKIACTVVCMLGLSVVAFAKPAYAPGVKCIECHEAGKFNKAGVKPKAKEMFEKFKDKKCTECHENKDGKLGKKADADAKLKAAK